MLLFIFRSRRGLVGSVLAYLTKSQGSSPWPDIKIEIQISGKNSESK